MITFKNIELTNYLKARLNLTEDVFNENDLLNIEEIHLNSKNFADEYNFVDINELKYFKNLDVLKLSNLTVNEDVVNILNSLKNLNEISFVNCVFEKGFNLNESSIEKLIINNCTINNDGFIYEMNYLKELNIIGSYLNFKKLSKFYFLKSLNIASSTVVFVDDINLPSLEELVLDYSNITDLKFVLKLNNLKRLSLSKNQINENSLIIGNLIKNGVQIYENNIIKIEEVK